METGEPLYWLLGVDACYILVNLNTCLMVYSKLIDFIEVHVHKFDKGKCFSSCHRRFIIFFLLFYTLHFSYQSLRIMFASVEETKFLL